MDTLYVANDSLKVYFNVSEEIFANSHSKYFWLSPLVIALIFVIERFLTSMAIKRERKDHYLIDIVVNNFLKKITSFFSVYTQVFKEDAARLISFAEGAPQYRSNCKLLIEKLRNQKNDFEYDFISVVRAIDSGKADQLTRILNNIQDVSSTVLGMSEITQEKIDIAIAEIMDQKGRFYTTVYDRKNILAKNK